MKTLALIGKIRIWRRGSLPPFPPSSYGLESDSKCGKLFFSNSNNIDPPLSFVTGTTVNAFYTKAYNYPVKAELD
jgi:hypothetical protein